jgi:hypothetical protein
MMMTMMRRGPTLNYKFVNGRHNSFLRSRDYRDEDGCAEKRRNPEDGSGDCCDYYNCRRLYNSDEDDLGVCVRD